MGITKAFLVNFIFPLIIMGIWNRYSMNPICVPSWIPVDLPCSIWGLIFWGAVIASVSDLAVYGVYPQLRKVIKRKTGVFEWVSVIGFDPNKLDPRPTGILVASKKKSIRCAVTLKTLRQKNNIVAENQSLGWYEDEQTRNFGYAVLEKSEPALVVLEKITKEFRDIIHIEVPSGKRITDKFIEIEFENSACSIRENFYYVAEIEFSFLKEKSKIVPPPIRFGLEYNGLKLEVKKL